MKKFLAILILSLTLLSGFSFIKVMAQESNLEIYFETIDVHANGTYTTVPAPNVIVVINQTTINYTQIQISDTFGRVVFSVNGSGVYNLNATLIGYIFVAKNILVNVSTTNVFHEFLVKSQAFLLQKQTTIFREFQLYLPCFFGIDFPTSDVNVTLESYGLKANLTKGPDLIYLSPEEASDKVIVSNQSFYYPNYTLTVNFKTYEEGFISLRVISEGKFIIHAIPLYLVGAETEVSFQVVIHVAEPIGKDVSDKIYNLDRKLDMVLLLLQKLVTDVEGILIPNVTSWFATFDLFKQQYFGNITLNTVVNKISQFSTSFDTYRSDFTLFKDSIGQQISNSVISLLSDFKNTTYLLFIMVVFFVIAVIIQFLDKRSKKGKFVRDENVSGRIE